MRQTAGEWFHLQYRHFGTKHKLSYNAAVSTRTRTGISLRTGRETSGFQNHVVAHGTQPHPNFTKVPDTKLKMIAESKFQWAFLVVRTLNRLWFEKKIGLESKIEKFN